MSEQSEQSVLKVTKITIEDDIGDFFSARCYSGDLVDGAEIPESEMLDHILILATKLISPNPSVPTEWILMLGNQEWFSEEIGYLEAILAEWMQDEGFDLPADMATSHPDWEGF